MATNLAFLFFSALLFIDKLYIIEKRIRV